MGTPNWEKVNAFVLATECSARHVQSVIEDAQRDIAELVEALRHGIAVVNGAVNEFGNHAAWENFLIDAEGLLARIDGETA